MMAKKESDDGMGLIIGIDHRVHGELGGVKKGEVMKIIDSR